MSLLARKVPTFPVALGLCGIALTSFYTAWLSDDCFFTLRTVANALAGHGLRWNVFERVQAYTHPLWMLTLLGPMGVAGEHYLTTIFVCWACSLAAVCWLTAACKPAARPLVLALLLLSRAFVDYTTSGLENPLSYLLASLLLWRIARRGSDELFAPALLVACAALARLDTLLLYAPLLALRTWRARRRSGSARVLATLALALAPLAAWELFSFYYYGFLFPNTAYAKLRMGLSSTELAPRGLLYLFDSLRRDPPTELAIAAACALALRRPRGDGTALALGILSYLVYVVRIGGDFMTGRMLALPFFVSCGLLGQLELAPRRRVFAFAPALAALLGLWLHRAYLVFVPPPAGGVTWPWHVIRHGIADERVFYFGHTGLLRPAGRFQREPPLPLSSSHRPGEVVRASFGMQAFQAGPQSIVLERYGLADPLLARLPARFDPHWRVGHYLRFLPAGYLDRLENGDLGALEDRELARYDGLLRQVTSGPLWSLERLRIALDFAFGRFEHLIDREAYRYPLLCKRGLVPDGHGRWIEDGPLGTLAVEGARLSSPSVLRVSGIELEAEGGALRRLLLLDGDAVVWSAEQELPRDGHYSFAFPERPATGVWIQPEPSPPGESPVREMRLAHVTLLGSGP